MRVVVAMFACCTFSCACGPEATNASGDGSGNSEGGASTGSGAGDASQTGQSLGGGTSSEGSTDTGSMACAMVITTEECDPWCQGCAAGFKCTPVTRDGAQSGDPLWAARCTPLAPEPKAPGESCTIVGEGEQAVDDCVVGSVCVTWLGDAACVPLCAGTPDAPDCPTSARCVMYEDPPIFAACLQACDPLGAQFGCEVTTQSCYAYPNLGPRFPMTTIGTFACLPDSGSGFDYGVPCEFTNGCDGGFLCAPPELVPGCAVDEFGCCTPFCDTTADGECPEPGVLSCLPVFEPGAAPEGLRHIGACVLGG